MLISILEKRGVTSRYILEMRLVTEMDKIKLAWWSPENHRFLRPAGDHTGNYQPRQHGCFPPSAEKLPHAASARPDSRSVPPGAASAVTVETPGIRAQALRPSDREAPYNGKGHRLSRLLRRDRADAQG